MKREPSSGSLRSRWTSEPPPPEKRLRGPNVLAGDGLIADSRRPSSIRTYGVAKISRAGACGQIGKITSSWKLAGRVTPDGCYRDLRPIPGAQSGAVASPRGENGHSGRPDPAQRQQEGTGPGAFEVRAQLTRCDFCNVQFLSRARRSNHRPKLYCPTHKSPASRRARAVAG